MGSGEPGGSLAFWDLRLCPVHRPPQSPAFLTLHNEIVDLFHFIAVCLYTLLGLATTNATLTSSLAFLMCVPLKLKTQEEEAPQTLKCSACLLALASGSTGPTCSWESGQLMKSRGPETSPFQ